MDKSGNIEIHETAFMTSMFRSSDEVLSGDSFAHLWDNDKTRTWVERHTSEVSLWEPKLHCLRNRFILDQIKTLYDQKKLEVVVNFGSGFSMYPFCAPESIQHVEIDKKEIIDYKAKVIDNWMTEGALPRRDVEFIVADFTKKDQDSLMERLKRQCDGRKSLFVIEGVFFFLSKQATKALFHLFDVVQSDGHLISVSYLPSIYETQAFKNLQDFFERRLGMGKEFEYQLIDDHFYKSQKNYDLIDHTEAFQLIKRYLPDSVLPDENDILNEHIYLLKKNLRDG